MLKSRVYFTGKKWYNSASVRRKSRLAFVRGFIFRYRVWAVVNFVVFFFNFQICISMIYSKSQTYDDISVSRLYKL